MSKIPVLILGKTFRPNEIAENSLQSWCEQYNDNCQLQDAWERYEKKFGEISSENPELLELIQEAVSFGAESALIEISNYEYLLKRRS